MKNKLKKKIFKLIAIAAFSISLLSLLFFILLPTPPKYDTFKIYPVRFSSEDKIELSEKVTQCNRLSTRIKVFLGSEIVIKKKDLKKSFRLITHKEWFKEIRSRITFDDFAGIRIFLMPVNVKLHSEDSLNLIWIKDANEILLSYYIWKHQGFENFMSIENYILAKVLSVVSRIFHPHTHDPSTNRCLNDYNTIQRKSIVAFQNGPLCYECRNALYEKAPEILRDIYRIYNIVECEGKRDIDTEKKGAKEEIEGLLFPKEQEAFDWRSWFGKLALAIISAIIGVISTYMIKKIKGKDKKEEN